jgi:hypothetical protein
MVSIILNYKDLTTITKANEIKQHYYIDSKSNSPHFKNKAAAAAACCFVAGENEKES